MLGGCFGGIRSHYGEDVTFLSLDVGESGRLALIMSTAGRDFFVALNVSLSVFDLRILFFGSMGSVTHHMLSPALFDRIRKRSCEFHTISYLGITASKSP